MGPGKPISVLVIIFSAIRTHSQKWLKKGVEPNFLVLMMSVFKIVRSDPNCFEWIENPSVSFASQSAGSVARDNEST